MWVKVQNTKTVFNVPRSTFRAPDKWFRAKCSAPKGAHRSSCTMFNPESWGYLVRKTAIQRSVRQWGGSFVTLTCKHVPLRQRTGQTSADCLAYNTRIGRHSGSCTKPQRRRERCISIGKQRFLPKAEARILLSFKRILLSSDLCYF